MFRHLLITQIILSAIILALAYDPEEKYSFSELVQAHGYILQEHEVTTTDGYILTIHRVVAKNYTNDEEYCKNRKPLIINHGLASESDNFFINAHDDTRDNSIVGDNFGFGMVATGRYDVWATNNRGNTYSNKHKTLTTKDKQFWHFSMDQMVQYDLPETIEYIRNKTGHKTVSYVGHSQGGAIMFGLLAERPEYAEIVKPFVSWAGASFVTHMRSIIKIAIPLIDYFKKVGGVFDFKAILKPLSADGPDSCRVGKSEEACERAVALMAGPSNHVDKKRLIIYMQHFPSPISMWQVCHFGQLYRDKSFQKFDFGVEGNRGHYNQDHPPKYPLENISPNATIFLSYGATDFLVSPEDAKHMISILKPILKDNLVEYKVPADPFNHLDFLVGFDAVISVVSTEIQEADSIFSELVQAHGYILQEHQLTTTDGYILMIHRIVTKNYTNDEEYCKDRKPLILNHGLSSASDNFFINAHDDHSNDSKVGDNFGFGIMAIGRYDVWAPNNRGNMYSTTHKTLSNKSIKFWDYSVDELIKYDLPETIEFIRNKTGHETVSYVGHSQGGVIMFGLLSERPEYAEIVKPFVSWGGTPFFAHMRSLKGAISFIDLYKSFTGKLDIRPFLEPMSKNHFFSCQNGKVAKTCKAVMNQLAGPSDLLDTDRIAIYIRHAPSPIAMMQFVHFGQLKRDKKFQKFDYGKNENLKKYNQDHPPEYLLENISPNATIFIAYGMTDYMVTPEDSEHAISILKPILKDNLSVYKVPVDLFNHYNFIIGKGIGKLLYDKTLEYLDQHY
ncbi:hypothetical protein BLOT_009162 [Blomia tropicalis]|nr:hypothetical protein BLOT_009162 [Blomia tropicalis]